MPKNDLVTDKLGLKYAQILGVRVNITSEEELLNTISGFIQNKHKFSLFTPNPEFVLMATQDKEL